MAYFLNQPLLSYRLCITLLAFLIMNHIRSFCFSSVFCINLQCKVNICQGLYKVKQLNVALFKQISCKIALYERSVVQMYGGKVMYF